MNGDTKQPTPPTSSKTGSKLLTVSAGLALVVGLISLVVSLPFVSNDCRSDEPAFPGDFASAACVTAKEVGKVVLVFGVCLVLVGLLIVLLIKRH